MSLKLKWTTCCLAALCGILLLPLTAPAIELIPFATSNQSPLIQIFGLPPAEPATLMDSGQFSAKLTLDIASSFTKDTTATDSVYLDGETYRTNLGFRYGVNERLEVGIDIPYISHVAGVFDSFIDDFHRTFNLPGGGRNETVSNKLEYRYTRDGQTLINITDSTGGLGDLRLSAAWKLFRETGTQPGAAAVRVSLKLPTGDSDKLLGSGGTDLALSLNGQREFPLENSRLAAFASLGTLLMTDGEVLKDQRRNLAAFGSLGLGWAAYDWLALKAQLDGNTSMYKDSDLIQIDSGSVQLVLGGSFKLAERTILDIALVEDIWVHTSPDAVFHFALRKVF